MGKYKVGDMVKVRSDLVIGKYYGYYSLTAGMASKRGCFVTIVGVNNDDEYLVGGFPSCCWSEDMFERYDDSILFAKLNPNAIIPSKRDNDGCYDLYVSINEDVVIQPHQMKLIPTGICSTFSNKYRIGIRERGSNTKSGLITMAGQIDSNYTGEWFLALYNIHDIPVCITREVKEVEKHEDFVLVPVSKAQAQFAVEIVPQVGIKEVDAEYIKGLKTDRGIGKIGSSGK